MSVTDQITALAQTIPSIIEHIQTEAATRSALVDPFIRALGYNPSNPLEVVPEFGANLDVPGVPKDKRVDYAILSEGKPIILIECKHHDVKLESGLSQLFNYYTPTEARIGLLTDGLVYKFYADLEKPGVMDKKPYMVLDLQDLQDPLLKELGALSKASMNIDGAIDSAVQLKYSNGIKALLKQQLDEPHDEFIRFFFKELCPENQFTGNLKKDFQEYVPSALNSFIREEIDKRLDQVSSRSAATVSTDVDDSPEPEEDNEPKSNVVEIETTPEELEGYYLVKAILHETVEPDRVIYRDRRGFFNILLDNSTKPLCRLYFNNLSRMRIGLFDADGSYKCEERIDISNIDEIYQYASRIKATVQHWSENQD